jgi:hypothetical protein
MGSFFADDQSYALGPALQDVARDLGDPRAVTRFAIRFRGRCPG